MPFSALLNKNPTPLCAEARIPKKPIIESDAKIEAHRLTELIKLMRPLKKVALDKFDQTEASQAAT